MQLDSTVVVHRSPGPVETTVGNEIILMSVDSGLCYGLGEPGSDVWRLLAEPIRVDELIAKLKLTYQAPAGEIEQDVAELLEDLRSRKLVEFGA